MGGSSKPPSKTSTTITQNTIDPAMVPYFTGIAKRAQGISNTPYVGYTGETVAGFDPMEINAQNATAALTSPGEYDQAQAGYQRGLDYNPGMFGAAEAAQYMSPYAQNVTDIGIRDLNEQAARSMALAGINSARTGGYGGSGNAIMNATTARTLNRDVGDLSTKGAQESYLNAQQQYQRDRTAREYAQTLGQNSASGLASLGTARQATDLARIGAQNASGTARRDLQQSINDRREQEFYNQRDHAKNNIAWESGILNGQPMGSYTQDMTYRTPSNSASQLAGTATALVGAYNDSNQRAPTYAKGGSVMSGLTTGPFQNQSATWAQLMQLTPQQMADASAPDYLKIAAMNAQDNIRQQGQPAAGPAAPPVAQQVVDKSVGAPPAGQAMPASPAPAPTQMAAHGGYIHDYGVASLPYEANYGHGGIVSFDGSKGSEVKAPPAPAPAKDPDGLMQQLKTAIQSDSVIADGVAVGTALALSRLPGWIGKAISLLPSGGKQAIVTLAKKVAPAVAIGGAGIAAKKYAASVLNAPPLDAAKAASETEMLPGSAATDEPSENDPFAGLGGGVASLIKPVTLPPYVDLDVSAAQTAEQLQARQDVVNANYGVGKDFFEQERAKNDEKLSALEAQRKGVYSGQGLMDFGAAMASGESSNFLDNFAKAVPAYTGAVKSGNEYARNRQDLLDTHADLLRGQERSEGRSDAANMLAAETASADKAQAGKNANTENRRAALVQQADIDLRINVANADSQARQAELNSRVAIAKITAQLRSQIGSGHGLSSNQRAIAFQKYSEAARPGFATAALDLKFSDDNARNAWIDDKVVFGFRNMLHNSGIDAALTGSSGKGGDSTDLEY